MDKFAIEVNSLLAYLRGFQVVKLVATYYDYYHNDSPPQVLKEQIDKVQCLLDQKEEKQ